MKFTDLAQFQDKQLEAWYTLMTPECKYLLYGGAAYGGKSYFLRWAAIGLGMYYFSKYGIRNVPIGLFSEDYPTLRDRQVIKMKHEIPSFLGEIKQTRDEGYSFIAKPEYGSFIILLRNLDDPSKYSSTEFAAILVEELTKDPRDTFDDLRFRLRYPNIDDSKFIAATNPGGVGHGYVKRLWVKPDPKELDIEQDRFKYIPAKYSDNKFTTPGYIKQLDSLPSAKRRAYKEGDWDVFAGQYFEEWRDALHTINPFIPQKKGVLIGGMDWGRTKPFSFHLGEVNRIQMESGTKFYRVKIFIEAYGTDKTAGEWSKIIKAKLKFYDVSLKDIAWVQADNRIFVPGDDKSKSIRDQFIDDDEEWRRILQPSSKDRIGGWENYHNWLKIAPDGIPYYQVTTDNPNLIRTVPELVHDDNKVEDVDTRGEDHAPDDQRYMLKKIKWIDAGIGAAFHPRSNQSGRSTVAHFIKDKQLSVDLDAWAEPNGTPGTVGGVSRN